LLQSYTFNLTKYLYKELIFLVTVSYVGNSLGSPVQTLTNVTNSYFFVCYNHKKYLYIAKSLDLTNLNFQ